AVPAPDSVREGTVCWVLTDPIFGRGPRSYIGRPGSQLRKAYDDRKRAHVCHRTRSTIRDGDRLRHGAETSAAGEGAAASATGGSNAARSAAGRAKCRAVGSCAL